MDRRCPHHPADEGDERSRGEHGLDDARRSAGGQIHQGQPRFRAESAGLSHELFCATGGGECVDALAAPPASARSRPAQCGAAEETRHARRWWRHQGECDLRARRHAARHGRDRTRRDGCAGNAGGGGHGHPHHARAYAGRRRARGNRGREAELRRRGTRASRREIALRVFDRRGVGARHRRGWRAFCWTR